MFEFEDKRWFPTVLRNAMTGVLEASIRIFRLYEPAFFQLRNLTGHKTSPVIVDLCSGAGGGAGALVCHPGLENVRLFLTDKYPNEAVADRWQKHVNITFIHEPVDAITGPLQFPQADVFTLFAGFHHFNFDESQAFLENLEQKQASVLIVEGASPGVLAWLGAIFFLPVLTFLMVPFIKPFRPVNLFLTYLLPVIPLLVWWDGMVSLAKIRSHTETMELCARLLPSYYWQSNKARTRLGIKMSWVSGKPL